MPVSKKPKAALIIPGSPPPVPIWKRPWVWFSSIVAAVAVVLAGLVSILSDARALPSEWAKTSNQFFSWYAEYEAWKGHWSTNDEPFVDAASMNLSKEDFRIIIDETDGGEITGTIETRGICDNTPMFEFLTIQGTIASASKAQIDVFDWIGGHRRLFAKLNLRRDGNVMSVIPDEDPAGLFADETRIALDPNEMGTAEDRLPVCGDKGMQFIMDAAKEAAR